MGVSASDIQSTNPKVSKVFESLGIDYSKHNGSICFIAKKDFPGETKVVSTKDDKGSTTLNDTVRGKLRGV